MKVQLRAALALLSSASVGAMAMDYAPLQCNADAVPPVESMDCLEAAAPLSALVASHGSSAMPLTVPCGTCVVVDQVDGSAVTVPGGINVLGRLHFPPSANVAIETTAVFVQGVLSAEEPSVGNKVRVTLYGSDDVTFYPHEECCSGAAADHRGLLRASGGGGGGGGRGLMQNGCDAECAHKKNVSMKPIVVAGGKLDIRAVNPACPSWTVLSDVTSVDPPPIASGCRPDGSLLRGDGTFESGTVPAGMTGGALATETAADGAANGFYRVSNRAFALHGVFVEMDAACAIPGRRYRFAAKHRLENGAMDDEFLGQISYQKPGQDWVVKHFMLCKNRVPGPNQWSEPCHDDFLIDENVAGAAKIKVEYFPTNQDRSVNISFDDVRMDLVYDPLVAGFETSSEFASCLDVGDEVVVTSSSMGDQAFEGHQIFTVASVDPVSGAFDFDDQRMYQTIPTLSGPGEPVYAAEVARLTRRFVFDARNDGPDPLHGGHFIVMHTPDVVQTVSGLEVRNFGQQGRLGRYPVHFHMSGDVSGSVVSKNVVRDSHQRCYVIHGTDNLRVEDNVAFDAKGHCYILEDGGETGNTFERNLAAKVDTIPLELGRSIGASDNDAASFWITNPQNNYIANVAAGGRLTGYWFETLGAVVGPSADLPKNEGVVPMYLPLGEYVFKDNVAHSCKDGVRTYFPGWKPSELSVIDGLKSYKNSNLGIFIHGTGNVAVRNALLADNWDCAGHNLHNAYPNFIEDSRCVGLSRDVLHRYGPLCRTGINYSYNEPPEAQLRLRNVTFEGWADMHCDALALRTLVPDRDPRYAHATLHATDLHFDSDASKPDIPCSLVAQTGDKDLFLEDVDGLQGSPTGNPGFLVQDEDDMLAFLPGCVPITRRYGSCAVFCEGVCLRRAHVTTDVSPGEVLALVISDGTTTHSYGRHPFTNDFEPVLPGGRSYDAHFVNQNGQRVYPGGVGLSFVSSPQCSNHITRSSIAIADRSNTDAILAQIPEAVSGDYRLVYELNIPSNPKYQDRRPVYSTDNHLDFPTFGRIAYFLELDNEYVWVSMDAFTDDSRKIGVPCLSPKCGGGTLSADDISNMINSLNFEGGSPTVAHDGATVIQKVVDNVNVVSNVAGLSGSGYAGNVEFWPFNYRRGNAIGIPGASATAYDFGDDPSTDGNYGSMQVHVHGDGPHVGTVFAFNRFNDGAVADLGIGNKPIGEPDWALSNNANAYDIRKLRVYVGDIPAASTPTRAPTLSPTARPVLPLPTTNPTTASPTPSDPVKQMIHDAHDFNLVYELDIPTHPAYQSARPQYAVDNSLSLSSGFTRIAYYLELDNKYVWASFDAFSADPRKIGVPCLHLTCGDGVSPNVFQQVVNNVNVVSNVPGLGGSGLTGNVEFWPYDYIANNALGVIGASDTAWDNGDTNTGNGSFGSMQLHLLGGQTVFAFNRFNTGSPADLGIDTNTMVGGLLGIQPDWSLSENAGTFAVRKLKVYANFVASSPGPTSVSTPNPTPLPTNQPTNPTPPPTNAVALPTRVPTMKPTTASPTPLPTRVPTMKPTTASPTPSDLVKQMINEAREFSLVYELDIPTHPAYQSARPQYAVDNSLSLSSGFTRIAYYLELNNKYVWASFDAFSADPRKIGVPCLHLTCGDGASPNVFQQVVRNVNVVSNVPGLGGSGLIGNVEFWPYDYIAHNALGVIGASDTAWDNGDTNTGNGSFGSMQLHLLGGQTVFAFNRFNTGSPADLGIDTNTMVGGLLGIQPDWSASQNAGTYTVRKLKVYANVVN